MRIKNARLLRNKKPLDFKVRYKVYTDLKHKKVTPDGRRNFSLLNQRSDLYVKRGFFIGELSQRVGIPPHTIRYYERLGLINPPERSETQYRIYSEEDEARLRFIKQAKLFDLSLDEIREIIDLRCEGIAPCEYLRGMIKRHLDDLDGRIQEMIAFRDELARRYERLKSAPDTTAGTICGFIEQESSPSETSDD